MVKDFFLDLIKKYSDNKSYNLKCWSEIEASYSSKHRYYHNLKHIETMLFELDKVKSKIVDLDSLLFSIYYHDIICEPTQSDNELQSVLTFEKRISNTSFINLNKCKIQIEATKEHNFSNNYDTNILLDLDLIILGQSHKEYLKYTRNIRKEYKIYPDFIYRKGR